MRKQQIKVGDRLALPAGDLLVTKVTETFVNVQFANGHTVPVVTAEAVKFQIIRSAK